MTPKAKREMIRREKFQHGLALFSRKPRYPDRLTPKEKLDLKAGEEARNKIFELWYDCFDLLGKRSARSLGSVRLDLDFYPTYVMPPERITKRP